MKQRDIRLTSLYKEAAAFYERVRQPATGQVSEVTDVHVAPDGRHAAFAGALMDTLQGLPATRICRVALDTGHCQVLTFGPNTDTCPRYSPDGRRLAFLSDRRNPGDPQLYWMDLVQGSAHFAGAVNGWVEYLHWSPDGARVLLGVAGHGADVSGVRGAITSSMPDGSLPSWMPLIKTGQEAFRWRSLWTYEWATGELRQLPFDTGNVWEATWCGNNAVLMLSSPNPDESFWYSAHLQLLDLGTGAIRTIYRPRHQLGCLSASASGKHAAVVEAICSDRGLVSGDLHVIDVASGGLVRADTRGVDVTSAQWCSEQRVLVAGHRGLTTAVGMWTKADGFAECWASQELATQGSFATVAALGEAGDFVLASEGFSRAPEIAAVCNGCYRTIKSFDLGYSELMGGLEACAPTRWSSSDGLELEGWLLLPKKAGPRPLVMQIHGGPVWHWHPLWLGRRGASVVMLLDRGYAVFFPNPRGSTGRGQEFAGRVLGDMAGADTQDYLSGVDHLVQCGIADPTRLGLTGASYGGYMTSWLITQDERFAAAVSVAPMANLVTERLTSNIPHFVDLFVSDDYTNSAGNFYKRSPIMHARRVKTPTLNICGALDRCTPPTEAEQFHNALLENGVESVLVTYPQEGHGIRSMPACADYAARLVAWFEGHIRA